MIAGLFLSFNYFFGEDCVFATSSKISAKMLWTYNTRYTSKKLHNYWFQRKVKTSNRKGVCFHCSTQYTQLNYSSMFNLTTLKTVL